MEVCDWGPMSMQQNRAKTEEQRARWPGPVVAGRRRGCGSLPRTPTLPLFLHLHSLDPGIFLIILHTLNLASSSQPCSNLQQVEPHGNKERAGGCSWVPPHDL